MARSTAISCLILLALTTAAHAAETETQYLSGKGKDDPVKWDFMCSAGMNSGKWSTIGVPSNWELQGFGNYTYGTARPNPWPKVTGNYKRTFTTPANWADKKVFITFEGVMTDTQVKINGESAGPIHQGGYYEFKYDITKFLKPAGTENLLEVTVDD
ncbi:MAG TPA: glycoside hydrolase family 2, partial [Phycisphaerae bacterium]|nr:glycoside hydrolase family 2 [Phycisphaerae bacterium]